MPDDRVPSGGHAGVGVRAERGHAGVVGLVLAGGLARRMGGIDKGLAAYRGAPLIAHVARRLAPQVGALWINANRNAAAYAPYAAHVMADLRPEHPGPLAGLEAGLAALAAGPDAVEWLCTVPCDAPHLPLDLVERLLSAARAAATPVAVARADAREQPVFALAHRDTLPALRAYLARGERRVGGWYAALPHSVVDFDDASAFANLNTLAQLAEASPPGD